MMASRKLTAVVIGAGWAGEGHTKALQHCGVKVLAICARQDDVVQRVAAGLGVPNASTDWRQSLVALQPDIVSLATPAALRTEVAQQAVELGCHVLCEKPLATTVDDAKRMYTLVREAGVKHAYAATQRYEASALWLAELILAATVGQARVVRKKAPFVPEIHDGRQWMSREVTPEEAEKAEQMDSPGQRFRVRYSR